jgi:hypothetical protein
MLFVLKVCTRAQVREHALAVKLGFVQQVFVGDALLHTYASAGLLGDSRWFFDDHWVHAGGGHLRGTYLVQRNEASRFVDR